MSITINIYYKGENGNAKKFADEMISSGIVDRFRNEEGNEKYEYFFPMNDKETVLLIDKSREDKLGARDRSLITISALFAQGLYPQLKAHLAIGKEHGLTKEEVVEVITQLAFYCGWPKAWSTFPLIEEVYGSDDTNE